MTVEEIAAVLEADLLVPPPAGSEPDITEFVASDLMSEVLVVDHEHFALLTALPSDQVIRTADVVGAPMIIFVNGKQPPESTTRLAADEGVTVLRTAAPTFEACARLAAGMDSTAP